MQMKKYIKLFTVLVFTAALICVSCTEPDDDTTKESMTGVLGYSLPAYVLKGSTATLSAQGVVLPSEYQIKWVISSVDSDTLAGQSIRVQFPDSLGDFTVTAVAQADGYYALSNSAVVTTIDTTEVTGSITGFALPKTYFVDPRDNTRYRTTEVGNLEWFAENLAWEGAGKACQNAEASQYIFGRFYTWEEATGGVSASGFGNGPQGACPEGWSVPTNEDWMDLAAAVAGEELPFGDVWQGVGSKLTVDAYFNGERLWPIDPDNRHEGAFNWNALPLGYSQFGNTYHKSISEYGMWWSSTEKNPSQAYYRYIFFEEASFPPSYIGKDDFAINVRCVRKR